MILQSILDDEYWGDDRSENSDQLKELADVLSKKPDFTGCNRNVPSNLLVALLAMASNPRVFKQALHLLPQECRCMSFTRYMDSAVFDEDDVQFEPSIAQIQLLVAS